MARAMTVTFLGTSSGGGPTESRNCSSLVVDCLGNGALWMVDCAEGTTRQFSFQPPDSSVWLKPHSVKKMFITHMHADHVMGVVPMLRNVLFAPSINPNAADPVDPPPRVEIYGPAGIRTFIRSILNMTLTRTGEKYIKCYTRVNTPAETSDARKTDSGESLPVAPVRSAMSLSMPGPSYIATHVLATSSANPQRPHVKSSSWATHTTLQGLIPLCISPSPSLLIHEATDAHIPPEINPQNRRTPETVVRTALARGHSIPQMAGEFAKTIGAEKLVLNHIGGRFPAPRHERDARARVIREIERQASEAWGSGRSAVAAWDFMRVALPAPNATVQQPVIERVEQVSYADPVEGLVYVNNRKRKW
ncbi:beta-lactamase-like protein [Mycena rebaudengoi]|nr:beta-lactamase-like protein [Mycena rebaudengoi]